MRYNMYREVLSKCFQKHLSARPHYNIELKLVQSNESQLRFHYVTLGFVHFSFELFLRNYINKNTIDVDYQVPSVNWLNELGSFPFHLDLGRVFNTAVNFKLLRVKVELSA